MNLKTKILLVTVAGLIGMLVLFSLLIYVFFVRVTTDGEVRLLWNRAQIVLRKPEIRVEEEWGQRDLLREFLIEGSMVRIIDPAGVVRAEISDNVGLSKLRPVYRTAYHTKISTIGVIRRIYIQVPILKLPEREQIGILELGRSFNLTEGYLRMLLLTLSLGTLIGALASVGVAFLYVRWIYKPVAQLAGTMEAIEESGAFGRLSGHLASGTDEFGKLGGTFNRMIARLEENYDRQRHFVQDASHELRTPLTVIQSYAGMLRRWGGEDPVIREEAVTAIEQEAARLKQLVQDLLRSADGEAGWSAGTVKRFDVLELARTTAAELALSFRRDIAVSAKGEEAEAAGQELAMEGREERIKQLLIILLDNAAKYSDKEITVQVDTSRNNKRILLAVKDRGIGIAQEHIRKLFDRFYRVDQARARGTGGSGLGLSIAQKIVKEHEGRIFVQSKPGKGTTVIVSLPRTAKDRLRNGDGPLSES